MQQCAQTATACMRLVHAARTRARACHTHRVGGCPVLSKLQIIVDTNPHAALCMDALMAVCRHALGNYNLCTF